jgi:hypothetical protein
MKEIPLYDFLDRAISSKKKVQFSFVDPCGHMNSSRFLESSKSVGVAGFLEFKSVDLKTGKSVAIAPFLPSRSEEELIQKLPLASEYTAQLKDYPSDLL